MLSDFIVQHPTGPFFSLTDTEYRRATKKFPALSNLDGLNYLINSVTAGINVGQEGYFDNETILNKFEKLFMLLSFKDDYKGHQVEVVVDNARTHSAKEYSLNDFQKGIGTKCPVDSIEYVSDNGQLISISGFFSDGKDKGKSKGLFELAKELQVQIRPDMKLADIRAALLDHPAFQNASKLELLARKYQVKIIFCPKFHCELNAIEGLWCQMKQYVRARSDQTFPSLLRLLPESRKNFEQRKIPMKLLRCFWRSLDPYNQGSSYSAVLKFFFSQLWEPSVVSHRKITKSRLS